MPRHTSLRTVGIILILKLVYKRCICQDFLLDFAKVIYFFKPYKCFLGKKQLVLLSFCNFADMKSLRELYRIGKGPSSSHTMGPQKAAQIYLNSHADVRGFRVTLYGSLAATGKGHMTDVAIKEVLEPVAPVEIVWRPDVVLPFHPNGMKFESKITGSSLTGSVNAMLNGSAYSNRDRNDKETGKWTDEWVVYSIGGGALSEGNDKPNGDEANLPVEEGKGKGSVRSFLLPSSPDVYPLHYLADIQKWCDDNGCAYWEYVQKCEEPDIWDYLLEVWHAMRRSVEAGIDHEGRLPGPLNLQRKAATYYVKAQGYQHNLQSRGLVYAYALAVSEENASGGTIVTAPTCGSCGVMPGVLYHLAKGHSFTDEKILRALATAGLIGNIVKENASISGADVGCQGEVGVACAMASAAACQLFGGSPSQIEYAAEMGLEHHLGMTCDPVCGLVQIPCIERNAFAATRALDCNLYAAFSDGRHRVSFDRVVEVMKQTGHDLPSLYKETGKGGLAATSPSTYK